MRVLLYVLGFWGGWVVGVIAGMALLGSQGESFMLFGLIGSGVGIWIVRKGYHPDPSPPRYESQQPQTTYNDNRSIDNRRVFNIIAQDKDEAAQILRQLEQGDEPAAIEMDDVRHKMLERKDKEGRAWPGYSDADDGKWPGYSKD